MRTYKHTVVPMIMIITIFTGVNLIHANTVRAQQALSSTLSSAAASGVTLAQIAASIEAVAGAKTSAAVCFETPWGKVCLQRSGPISFNAANISSVATSNAGLTLAGALNTMMTDFDQFARRARIPGSAFSMSQTFPIAYPSVRQAGVMGLIDIDIDIDFNF